MRKILLSVLLATAISVPAAAQVEDNDDVRAERAERRAEVRAQRAERRAEVRAQREQAREQRIERAERRAAPRERVVRERAVPSERSVADIEERRARVREQIRERSSNGGQGDGANVNARGRPTLGDGATGQDGVAGWRERERNPRGNVIERWVNRPERRVTPPPEARPDRPAPPPETATRRDRHPEWRRDWRSDHRYDWRRWRDYNRSRFHIGFYFDPFGWNYRRYNVGWRMWPSYYSNRYWLNDPWSYRLPYAPWPYKWVRYWDDAMLVNTRTGDVVDVIYDFFW